MPGGFFLKRAMSETADITAQEAPRPTNEPPASVGQAPLTPPADSGWTGDLKLLLVLAGPNVATMLAESLINLVDFWIASRLGSPAQAAVLSAVLVFMCIFAPLMGTMTCVGTMVSQSFGARRPRDCSAYAWQGVWVSLACGVIGVALWPFIPGLYALIGHEPDVQAMEVSYTRLRLLILGVAGANMALAEYFNGIQRPRVNTASVVGANFVNALLGYGLVFGVWGLPRLGFVGIAVSTVVANLVRMVWLLAALCTGESQERFDGRHTWRLDFGKVGRLMRVGWPAGAQFALDITAWTTFLVWIIGRFGTTHLAASHTCARLTDLSFMPAYGLGFAISALVGQSVGQGRPDIARRRARIGVVINMIYMTVMALVFVSFGTSLMRLFSDEPEVVRLGAAVLIVAALYQLFDAVAISYSLALRGAGDTLFPAAIGAVLSWSILVGGGATIVRRFPQWGIRGPWACAAVFVVVISFFLLWRWRRGRWERLDVIGRGRNLADEQARALDPLDGREVIASGGAVIGSSAEPS